MLARPGLLDSLHRNTCTARTAGDSGPRTLLAGANNGAIPARSLHAEREAPPG